MGYNKNMSRKKNQKVNIVFIIIMLIILGYFYYKFDPKASLQNKDDEKEIVNTKSFPDNLTIETKKINLKPNWYKEISAEYPVGGVVGAADVEKFVNDEASQFWCANDEEKVTEKDAKKKGEVSTYECNLEIKYSYTHSKKLLSHKLAEYGSGGVHGVYNAETFTYDVDGHKLLIADLVIDKESYKKDLSNKLKDAFKKYQNENKDGNFDDVLNDITDESIIDTLPFLATNDGLIFLFNETSGLPYGAGEIEIKLSTLDLVGVIKTEFLN